MRILSIETSCDETAVSVLELEDRALRVRGNALASQAAMHAQYGGVFPMMAKRAHAEKIIPLLTQALAQAELLEQERREVSDAAVRHIEERCAREGNLARDLITFAGAYRPPAIDHIAVTAGPGLEPALWVGINVAVLLGELWKIPVIPINHMEGHIAASLFEQHSEKEFTLRELAFPTLSLLVSGGHTELVLSQAPLQYKKIGQTRDDAVGEAFDKAARILGLPYPGGPKISALAQEARAEGLERRYELPRPMLHSGNYDFSFSGLKTAVLYLIRDLEKENPEIANDTTVQKMIAREFEEAAVEVLLSKTMRAIEEFGIQTVLVGGGVAGNLYLRQTLSESVAALAQRPLLLFPASDLSTDNSVMIAMASAYRAMHGAPAAYEGTIRAEGNLSIETK